MKNLIYILIFGLIVSLSSCSDFLEQESPSDVPFEEYLENPQNVRKALTAAYETWEASMIHSNGLFYELSVCSSDAEKHPEKYSDQDRHIPENLYYGGTESWNIDHSKSPYVRAYSIIAVCNQIITLYELTDTYKKVWMAEGATPTKVSQVYGEAITLRATMYFELCRYFGDVPHQYTSVFVDTVLTSRDYIYEYHINKLKSVIPIMYRPGEGGTTALSMNRTYAEGLLGRMCLYAGGYATRRTDLSADFYSDLDGNPISFDQIGEEYSGGVYTRRTDYKKFYEIAKTYLKDCVDNSGTVELVTSDPRGTIAQGYGNPFQWVFQQMLNLSISSESLYEIEEIQGVYSERPYAFGRPSGGGSTNNFPCKDYGQSRMHPTFYYGDYDPEDLRRDATVAVTASTGKGREILLSLVPGNKTSGGLANNKWDENRMNPPFYQRKRQAGVNNPYMRMSDVVLMLAEVYAVLGDEDAAKTELRKVRSRAFAPDMQQAKVEDYINGLSGDDLLNAILTERKFEFAGEGIRKWDMIRNGKFPEMIKSLKANLDKMVQELKDQGYAEFDNGNQLPAYVWTKMVDAKDQYGYRLTTQCTDKTDPVLFPGWRGQYNDWENVGGEGIGARYNDDYKTNVAIKGLFRYIDPNGSEAATLEADGYERQRWAADIVGTKIAAEGDIVVSDYSDEYSTYIYRGYVEGAAPIYLVPINYQTLSTSSVTNGYGFAQEPN